MHQVPRRFCTGVLSKLVNGTPRFHVRAVSDVMDFVLGERSLVSRQLALGVSKADEPVETRGRFPKITNVL